MEGFLVAALLVAIPVTAVLAVVSVLYLRHLYKMTPQPRSWLYESLYRADALTAVIGTYYVYLLIAKFLRLPMLAEPWNGILFGVTVIALMSPPISHAATIWWRRRH